MAYGLSDSKRWIVVFDLDDTLVTGYNDGEVNVINDNFFMLQKAVRQRRKGPNQTVQYIFLYTYNTDSEYVTRAIEALNTKLKEKGIYDTTRDLFDDINMGSSSTNTGRSNIAVNALSKQMSTIQRMYDGIEDRNKPRGPIRNRVIFVDNKIHNDLFESIGDNYAHVPFSEEDIPTYEATDDSTPLNASLNSIVSQKSMNKYKNRKSYDKAEWIRINEVDKVRNKLNTLPGAGPRSSLSVMTRGGRVTRRSQKKSKSRKTRTKN